MAIVSSFGFVVGSVHIVLSLIWIATPLARNDSFTILLLQGNSATSSVASNQTANTLAFVREVDLRTE